jgi:hypothetical protein
MRLWLAKTPDGLVGADDDSCAVIAKLGEGEIAEFEIRRPRSLAWHRRYFGTCATIGKNQDPARDADSIDRELRILAGHYDTMKLRDRTSGIVYDVLTPKRIAFHKMTAEEWAEYYRKGEPEWIARFGEAFWLEDSPT